MYKEYCLDVIISYFSGEEVNDDILKSAIEEISKSRSLLEELQLMIGENHDILALVKDQVLCSDILEMLPELGEMEDEEIQKKYPESWKHIATCRECQQSFLMLKHSLKELSHLIPGDQDFFIKKKIRNLDGIWRLKDIKKFSQDPIFHVVSGWIKNLPFSHLSPGTRELEFSFDELPNIDERGRLKASLSFPDKDVQGQVVKVALQDGIHRLELCEILVSEKNISLLIDLSFFPLASILLPVEAISMNMIPQHWFIGKLKELRDKNLSPVDFTDRFSEILALSDRTLENILEYEIGTYTDKIELASIIDYSKNQILNYVKFWELCNKNKPEEYEFVQALAKASETLPQQLPDKGLKEPETTVVRRRQSSDLVDKKK